MNDDLRLGYTEEEYVRYKKGARRCLIMFSLLYMSLYCCRLNLGNAAGAMMAGLGWTSKDIGILTSALFWAYGMGQLVNGRFSELAGPVRFITFAALLSPACNLLMSFQNSLAVMAAIWALNGFFQSMAWGPGLALLSRWWPGRKHGFATGFANAFSGLGQALSMVTAAAALKLMPSLGWRGCFILPAAVPVAVLAAFRLLVRESPSKAGLPDFKAEDPEAAENEERMRQLVREKGKLYPYLYMLKNRRFDAWLTIIFITGITRYGMMTWMPLYFSERFGTDVTAGLMQSLAFPVGMAAGTFVLPVLTDRFCPNDRLPAVIGCGGLLFASIAAFMFLDPTAAGGSAAVSAVLFSAGFAVYAINGCAFSYACDMGGRVFTATASGILDFSAYMGAAAQSVVYGFFLNSLGWNMVFASIAAMSLLITAIAAAGRKR